MAQVSQIEINNQAFSTFRTTMNDSLSAINSMHSGTSRPASATTGTLWLDTTNAGSNSLTIKFFDGSDDITFATIDTSANTVNFIDSVVTGFDIVTDTTPQLGGDLDLNSNDITGTGNINITGSLTASGNLTSLGIDDNATSTAITIDSSERIVLTTTGSTSSSPNLAIKDSGQSGTGAKARVGFLDSGNTVLGEVGYLSGGNHELSIKNIQNSDISFFTNNAEKMRLTSTGLGIGTSSPQSKLHVVGSSTSSQIIIENTDTGTAAAPDLFLYRNSSSPADGDSLGNIEFRGKNDNTEDTRYVINNAKIIDASDGTEDGQIEWQLLNAGSFQKTLTMNPTEVVINEDSGDTDFRVESNNNANMLFVDGGQDRIGIGESAPLGKFHITSAGSGGSVNSVCDELVLENSSRTGMTILSGSSSIGTIAFGDSGSGTISSINYDHSSNNLNFHTNGAEGMRIDSSGNLLVGKTSTSRPVAGIELRSTGFGRFTVDQSNPLELTRTTNDGEVIKLFKDNTHQGTVGFAGSNPFFSNSTSRGISLGSNVVACDNAGSQVDNLSDLGTSSARFKDLHLGGSITVGDSHTIGDDPNDNLEIKSSSSENIIYNSTNGLHLFEKNSTEVMRIDTNGNVGIGTSGPVSKVNIEATKTTALSSMNDFLTVGLTVDDNTAYNEGVGGGIAFRGKRQSGGQQTVFGAIAGTKRDNSNDGFNGNLRFFTNNNGNGVPTEHMRIDHSGLVGIGETAPQGKLHVKSADSSATASSDADELVIENGTSGQATGISILSATNGFGNIFFGDSGDNNIGVVQYDHANNFMRFFTNASERARLDASGDLLIGKTSISTNAVGVAITGSGLGAFTRSGDAPIIANRTSSDGNIALFRKDNSTIGAITARSGDMSIHSTTANHAGLRFGFDSIFATSSSGAENDNVCDFGSPNLKFKDIYLGGGVFLGGTGTSNKLSDYEEGTFTPTFTATTTNPTVTYQNQEGSYVKIGDLVHFQIYFRVAETSAGSGNLKISGLPFTSHSGDAEYGGMQVSFLLGWNGSGGPETGQIGGNSTDVQLHRFGANTSTVNAGDIGNSTFVRATGQYIAA